MIQKVAICDICRYPSETLENNNIPDGWEAAFDANGIFVLHSCTDCNSVKYLTKLLTLKHLETEDKNLIENYLKDSSYSTLVLETEVKRLTHKYCSRPGGVINNEPPIERVIKK